ncbi:MAG: twin transmembrane helix small protein [Cocleimonas sp.]
MEFKHLIIILFFIFIIYSLGSALYYMMKDQGGSKRMVKALTMRIGISILLFVVIIFSFWMGWIKPTGVA